MEVKQAASLLKFGNFAITTSTTVFGEEITQSGSFAFDGSQTVLDDENLDATSLNIVVKSTLKELRDLFSGGKYQLFGYDEATQTYKFFKSINDKLYTKKTREKLGDESFSKLIKLFFSKKRKLNTTITSCLPVIWHITHILFFRVLEYQYTIFTQ